MIGVFDSGHGGLTILRALMDRLPAYGFCYFGDHARAPYGARSTEEIYDATRNGVEFLFRQGCPLAILACNTSSAQALRRLQQEWLPRTYPDRRVLGVLVPTIEALADGPWKDFRITILATPSTVASGAYTREILKRHPETRVIERACPTWARLIEEDAPDAVLHAAIGEILDDLPPTDALLLGCTHYPLVVDQIAATLPASVQIVSQGAWVASALENYLERHPEMEQGLARTGAHRFFTSGDPLRVSFLASRLFGAAMNFEKWGT